MAQCRLVAFVAAVVVAGLHSQSTLGQCDEWAALGGGVGGAFGAEAVEALTVFDGQLIAGGFFTEAGGQSAKSIASWDGAMWQPLGSGMEGVSHASVRALTVYNGELVAGGSFIEAGGQPANRIARWDGSGWHPLGVGMNEWVAALTVYNGELIAGGYFFEAGGDIANHAVARWDGSTWRSLGTGIGINNGVRALTLYDGELIAGGDFDTEFGGSANHVARWDGVAWQSLGGGVNGSVATLVVYEGDLIAAGTFTEAGGVAVNHIARWNGASWRPLGGGITGGGLGGGVRSLAVHDASLIAGGYFTDAGGTVVRSIARWDGNAWTPLGDGVQGMSSFVLALEIFDGKLVAGGNFTQAGDEAVNHIARLECSQPPPPSDFGTADPDSPISAAGDTSGRVAATYVSTTELSVLLDRDPADGLWYVTALDDRGTIRSTPAASVTWVDPKDGETYAGVAAEGAFYVVVPDALPSTDRNLTAEIADSTPINAQPTVFISKNQLVFVAGLDAAGDLVMYRQTGGLTGSGLPAWTYVNLSRDHLEAQGQSTPEFQGGLVSYVTAWNGLNIAGLDDAGDVWGVWWAPGMSLWRVDNLSAITGAPSMAGGLTAFVTPWGAVNLAGVNDAGEVVVTWWAPGFGGDWAISNLSQLFDGPAMRDGSLSSFVTPWGALNVAGIDDQGELTVYWWAPGIKGWVVSPLSTLVEGSEPPVGRVTGITTPTGLINLFGATGGGDVVRYYWQPKSVWQAENVSGIATRR